MGVAMEHTDRAPQRPGIRERLAPAARAWRPLTVTWLVLFGAVTAVGLLIVGPFAGGRTDRWDLDVARWFVDHRSSTLDPLAEGATWLAETITLPVVLLVALLIAWRVSENVAAPVFLALAVGGEKLLYFVSSLIVGRDRPPVPTVGTSYATSSFPSGHVASTVTLYGSIALLIALHRSPTVRAALLAFVGFLAAMVAACRMYTGFHYLSDSVAGVLVGGLWLAVVYRTVLLPNDVPAIDERRGGRPDAPALVHA